MNQNGHRLINMLAYLGILFFLPLVFEPKSKIGRFHANQGLVLFLLGVAANIIFHFLPILGGLFSWLVNLVLLIAIIYGMYHAFYERMKPLPLIGKIILIS